MNKRNVVYPDNGLLLGRNRKKIQTHTIVWVNSEDIMLSETKQSEKDE